MNDVVNEVSISPMDLVRVESLKEISLVEAGLAALSEKYKGAVYEVATTAGMAQAKVARAEIREPRFRTEHARKAQKSRLAQIGKDVDAKAAQITAALKALEDPIHAQIEAEESRKEREKLAKAEEERRRTKAIRERIEAIRNTTGTTISELTSAITVVGDSAPADADYAEFIDEAVAVWRTTLERLKASLAHLEALEAQRLENERVAAELAAQRAEMEAQVAAQAALIEKQRLELAAQAAEQERIRAEAQAKEDEARRAQQEAEDAERRKAQEAEDEKRRLRKIADDYIAGLERIVLRASTADSASIQTTITNLDREELNLLAHQDEADKAHTQALADLRAILVATLKIEAEKQVEADRLYQEALDRAAKEESDRLQAAKVAEAQAAQAEKLRLEQDALDKRLADLVAKQIEEDQAKAEKEAAEKEKANPRTDTMRLASLQMAVHDYLRMDMVSGEDRRKGLAFLRTALACSKGGE